MTGLNPIAKTCNNWLCKPANRTEKPVSKAWGCRTSESNDGYHEEPVAKACPQNIEVK